MTSPFSLFLCHTFSPYFSFSSPFSLIILPLFLTHSPFSFPPFVSHSPFLSLFVSPFCLPLFSFSLSPFCLFLPPPPVLKTLIEPHWQCVNMNVETVTFQPQPGHMNLQSLSLPFPSLLFLSFQFSLLSVTTLLCCSILLLSLLNGELVISIFGRAMLQRAGEGWGTKTRGRATSNSRGRSPKAYYTTFQSRIIPYNNQLNVSTSITKVKMSQNSSLQLITDHFLSYQIAHFHVRYTILKPPCQGIFDVGFTTFPATFMHEDLQ